MESEDSASRQVPHQEWWCGVVLARDQHHIRDARGNSVGDLCLGRGILACKTVGGDGQGSNLVSLGGI